MAPSLKFTHCFWNNKCPQAFALDKNMKCYNATGAVCKTFSRILFLVFGVSNIKLIAKVISALFASCSFVHCICVNISPFVYFYVAIAMYGGKVL